MMKITTYLRKKLLKSIPIIKLKIKISLNLIYIKMNSYCIEIRSYDLDIYKINEKIFELKKNNK